jgi:hypothetical protein
MFTNRLIICLARVTDIHNDQIVFIRYLVHKNLEPMSKYYPMWNQHSYYHFVEYDFHLHLLFQFLFLQYDKKFHFSFAYVSHSVLQENHLMHLKLFDQVDNSIKKKKTTIKKFFSFSLLTFGLSRCVLTASIANGIHSITQP